MQNPVESGFTHVPAPSPSSSAVASTCYCPGRPAPSTAIPKAIQSRSFGVQFAFACGPWPHIPRAETLVVRVALKHHHLLCWRQGFCFWSLRHTEKIQQETGATSRHVQSRVSPWSLLGSGPPDLLSCHISQKRNVNFFDELLCSGSTLRRIRGSFTAYEGAIESQCQNCKDQR